MSSIHSLLDSSLSSTEIVLAFVDALSLANSPEITPQSIEASDNWHDRRILAAVSHKDDWAMTEEGALFVYRFTSPATSSVPNLDVQRIYPIYGNFSIVMSQMRRGTIDLSTANSKAVLDQPRSGFSLSVNPAEGLEGGTEAAKFYATDVQSLGFLIAECKRLKSEIAESSQDVNVEQSQIHFNWLVPYYSRFVHQYLLSSTPADLRVANKSLLDRLSPASAGFSGNDNTDIRLIRDEWVRNKARLMSRQGQPKLSLRLGTFNVNGKLPSQDLSSWIQGVSSSTAKAHNERVIPSSNETAANTSHHVSADIQNAAEPVNNDPGPDILALGFQELDLSTEALIYSLGSAREDAWTMAITAALGEKATDYEKLVSQQLVGMLIIIFVKKKLKHCFAEVKVTAAGSGILGVMGNKGATAVRLVFIPPLNSDTVDGEVDHPPLEDAEQPQDRSLEDAKDTGALTLTFVNAHLAAFDEMTDRRNHDFHDLSKKLTFTRDLDDYDNALGMDSNTPRNVNIYETDALFWMGDLNYRVDIPDLEFRDLLKDGEWDDRLQTLIKYDQLKKSILSKKAFTCFCEHPITFLPSYRYGSGLVMGGLGYDQKRRPAWTDRILYVGSPFCDVVQHSYSSYSQITMSDHRPVGADFSVQFDLYNLPTFEQHVRQLYHQVHVLDPSPERPTIKIDQSFLELGEVRYRTRLTKKVTIENVGKIPCAWRFVPTHPDSPIAPEWLSIEPITGFFLPGEKTEIALKLHIDSRVASYLNLGPRDISGTLILHTILGQDHFIAISGEYLPSCFGNKLATLTRLPGPIRALTSSKELRGENHPLNAPTEFMRLVNWLMGRTAIPKDLFLVSPEESMVQTIRECLDTGEEFPWLPGDGDAAPSYAFAQTLLELLDSLIEPIIPPDLHPHCIQTMGRDEAFELLDVLQPAAVNVWITLTAFLHFVCQSSDDSSYPEKIADIFTPVLMKDGPEPMAIPISPIKKRRFLLQFIS